MTAKLWSCDGYWKPTVWNDKKQPFSNMIVCDGDLAAARKRHIMTPAFPPAP